MGRVSPRCLRSSSIRILWWEARLVEGLLAAGLPRSEVEGVSLRDLVIFALTGPLKWGWGAHAVSWIESGFTIDDEVALALEQVAQDKRFPQRVRHRVFSAAKRWRRAHAAVVPPAR